IRRLFTKAVWCFALAATVAIGSGWGYQSGEGWEGVEEVEVKAISVSDCSFQRNPDGFFNALRSRMEELSTTTARFTRQSSAIQSVQAVSTQYPSTFTDDIASRGYIDDFIFGKMRQDSIPHAPLCSDAEFLRRVTLDLTGRIPTSAEVRSFLQSKDPNKRRTLIRQLLSWWPDLGGPRRITGRSGHEGSVYEDIENMGTSNSPSPGFVDKWTMFFGDLLRNTARDSNVRRYVEGRNAFYDFIREFVAAGMPYDVFVERLITGSGNNYTVGEANWVVGGITRMGPRQDTYDTLWVRAATQFLGLSHFDCLLCHAGAGRVDKVNLWSAGIERKQAWEMAAFFSRTRIRRKLISQRPRKYSWTVRDVPRGNYRLNTDSGNRPPRWSLDGSNVVKPRYIFSEAQTSGSTYREVLAKNLIQDRQFARATVNYLWKEMMGMGIVEPADQFDLARLDPSAVLPEGWSPQPTHPELLEALTEDFIHNGFSIRHILFLIADSNAYQLSSSFPGEWKVEYTPYFARKYVRRLWAEEIHDAITQATGVVPSYHIQGFSTPVQRAMQFPDPREPRRNGRVRAFLDFFLRGDRDQNPRSDEATILQALNMMNHRFVVSRIKNSNENSTVSKLLANYTFSDADLVEELFLSTLSRFPTEEEMSLGLAALKPRRVRGAENLQWVLLNKVDFLYNY
ncbi:MAG: DUF1553 domain-containing protein, partial [Acidobacteriota bacterium]